MAALKTRSTSRRKRRGAQTLESSCPYAAPAAVPPTDWDRNVSRRRWNNKKIRYREHTFLDNPHVPATLVENRVTVTVAPAGTATRWPSNRTHVELAYGTPMSAVKAAVLRANPVSVALAVAGTWGVVRGSPAALTCSQLPAEVPATTRAPQEVRLVLIRNADLRRLCRWLGSTEQNIEFNTLARYVLTESSRYCPTEDHGGYRSPGFDWQNPFTAYNCTWGFHSPA